MRNGRPPARLVVAVLIADRTEGQQIEINPAADQLGDRGPFFGGLLLQQYSLFR
jgi:hypothetical protein